MLVVTCKSDMAYYSLRVFISRTEDISEKRRAEKWMVGTGLTLALLTHRQCEDEELECYPREHTTLGNVPF